MKQTLLDITQVILSSMDSAEVNSIGDTEEAHQVALLCKNVYYDMINEISLPELESIFQLEPSLDNDLPTVMFLPSTTTKVETVRYNYTETDGVTPDYREMVFLTWQDFMDRQVGLGANAPFDVDEMSLNVNGQVFQFYYRNNKDPTFYTTFNDNTLLFDSVDLSKDTTLKKAKTLCTGKTLPTFLLVDTYIPQMDASQFPAYINKCKARAFNELKQQANQEAVAEARRQKIINQIRKLSTEDIPATMKHARYGRNGVKGYNDKIPRNLRSGS